MKTRLTIEFLSDWHIGEGDGARGYIDRTIRRDPADGLPYVPAKTLTGLMRDGCERVAQALDGGAGHGPWGRFAAELFGRDSRGKTEIGATSPARVWFTPARLPEALRRALVAPENAALKEALTFLKPGVKLDANGTAAHDMYRIEEMAAGGGRLEAEIALDDRLDQATRAAAQALLAAGAAAVERIGGKRRRGAGRCRIALGDWRIEEGLLLGAPPSLDASACAAATQDKEAVVSQAAQAATGAGRLRRHRLRLVALEPLQIPAENLGNFIGSRDHVPGSLLLAALDPFLRRALGDRGGQLTHWLAQGAIRIGFAYPEAAGARGLPTPLCLEQGKLDKNALRNRLAGAAEDGVQRKPLREGFVLAEGMPVYANGEPAPVKTARVSLTHAVIDDAVQRPTSEVGGVFTYEAIAPGTVLCGEILVDATAVGELDLAMPDGVELRLGRAKKDDYGRVRLRYLGAEDVAPPTGARERVTLWLISPAIIRDEALEPVTDAEGLTGALARELGLAGLQCTQAFYRLTREDGWQSAWNEPRPTRLAFAAGSVFVLEGAWTDAALARLAQGIGERCGEGYGEVRIDAPLLADEAIPLVKATTDGGAPRALALLPVAADDFTRALHRRAWLALAARAAAFGFEPWRRRLGWSEGKPPNSQLGALRAQWLDFDRERLRTWLEHLRQTPNRADKWPDKSLDELGRWAKAPSRVWLAIEEQGLRLPCLHAEEKMKTEFAEAAARVFWLALIGLEFDLRERASAGRNVHSQQGT